ncbi:hypothetical protein [Enterococcus faecalis]|uniref:hypothetical protein n=1 Tax=Enterococcus faecalis TaxID=1351 RepID=UPI002AFECEBD|nr:hypothetical protein [Enterococcus faecalis]
MKRYVLLLSLFILTITLGACKQQVPKTSETNKAVETTETSSKENDVPTLEQLKVKYSDLQDIGEVMIVTAYFSDNPYITVEKIGTSEQLKFDIENIEQKDNKVTFKVKNIEGLSKKVAIEEKFTLAKSKNKYYVYR